MLGKGENRLRYCPKKSISFFFMNLVNLYMADSHYGINIIDMIPPDKIMWYAILNLKKKSFKSDVLHQFQFQSKVT